MHSLEGNPVLLTPADRERQQGMRASPGDRSDCNPGRHCGRASSERIERAGDTALEFEFMFIGDGFEKVVDMGVAAQQ